MKMKRQTVFPLSFSFLHKLHRCLGNYDAVVELHFHFQVLTGLPYFVFRNYMMRYDVDVDMNTVTVMRHERGSEAWTWSTEGCRQVKGGVDRDRLSDLLRVLTEVTDRKHMLV